MPGIFVRRLYNRKGYIECVTEISKAFARNLFLATASQQKILHSCFPPIYLIFKKFLLNEWGKCQSFNLNFKASYKFWLKSSLFLKTLLSNLFYIHFKEAENRQYTSIKAWKFHTMKAVYTKASEKRKKIRPRWKMELKCVKTREKVSFTRYLQQKINTHPTHSIKRIRFPCFRRKEK